MTPLSKKNTAQIQLVYCSGVTRDTKHNVVVRSGSKMEQPALVVFSLLMADTLPQCCKLPARQAGLCIS